jgi:hypothetical protein
MLSVRLLPARQGDAIWIRWGAEEHPYQLLIDMGTEGVGEQVRERILALPEVRRRFELLVVTHVDRDHIGGVLTALAEADPIAGLVIGDVWFNGYPHLKGGSVSSALESMGPAQGARLGNWLKDMPWNRAFQGAPVQRVPGEDLKRITLVDDLVLTVLGPTPQRLLELGPVWIEEVEAAIAKGSLQREVAGLEPMGPTTPPSLEDRHDLEMLAETRTDRDKSEANGSSIVLLLEYRDKSVLLAGDAFGSDLIEGIGALGGSGRLKVDAFKLPHHCSQSNIVPDLVGAVDCGCWLVSTDGTQFRHPDPVALARIIRHAQPSSPLLAFNVKSKYSGWWDNDKWRDLFDYRTRYGSDAEGFELRLE